MTRYVNHDLEFIILQASTNLKIFALSLALDFGYFSRKYNMVPLIVCRKDKNVILSRVVVMIT